MINVEEVRRALQRAQDDGETEMLIRVVGIDQRRAIPMQCRAEGRVLLDQDMADAPVGEARHADVVWAVFKVREVAAWLARQEVRA
jgi:hypothetical protein